MGERDGRKPFFDGKPLVENVHGIGRPPFLGAESPRKVLSEIKKDNLESSQIPEELAPAQNFPALPE